MVQQSPFNIGNIRCFIAFRLFFNARFYYPVFTILFLDYGLTIEQFALLNSVWAATIVIAEVPSGALADLIGRKQLLLVTSVLMVLEMGLLSFVPIENISLVFWAFLFNRILSGLAEAMASGADEALAYDSLAEQGSVDDWPRVLSVMMRIKSLGSVITMSTGALIYDPDIVNRILKLFGSAAALDQQVTMRFPVYLTLILGLLSCYTVLRMEEAGDNSAADSGTSTLHRIVSATRLTLKAGKWIVTTPFALVVIIFAMGYDHILRMIITMTSKYLRLIDLPEASFGIIGAGMAILGLFIPQVAEKMVRRFSGAQNMAWMSLLTLLTLGGLALFLPYVGLLFVGMVSAGLMLTAFFTSHYLNRITDSHQRATVLSFKGLAFNLAYGVIGILFAMLMNKLRTGVENSMAMASETVMENTAFREAIFWFIPYTGIFLVVAGLLALILLRNTDEHLRKG